ncbi:DNA photolyase family protein [Flavobacteriaceae bacterium]|nr:DNA photolyase family protein [Flavobacteriaceae bacterium]
MKEEIVIFWFRRDLRYNDNTGLSKALLSGKKVLPIFIFDTEILDMLPEKDPRLQFIVNQLHEINQHFNTQFQSGVQSYHNSPLNVFKSLLEAANDFKVCGVYTNEDYEPYAVQRDLEIKAYLATKSVDFHSFKDQVVFEKDQVTKEDGKPYVVYTPYKNKWLSIFEQQYPNGFQAINMPLENLYKMNTSLHDMKALGFSSAEIEVPQYSVTSALIEAYEAKRNFPSIENGTSKLGPHLRFGTVSIRALVQKAKGQKNQVFLSELIWREFFMQILWHFPHTPTNAFKPAYDRIEWRNNAAEFEHWKNGTTGYPLVDAGMRELNATGTMHNRVRMLVASFLCKHLLIDWRWGEAYFAEKLLDFELASNVGNWQWAAGSGVDAAPYFRIFNPTTQIDKFDKQHIYLKKWVSDLGELTYPSPIVDHKMARERCLATYKKALA